MPLHNRATLSIAGLYNWDENIFDDLVVPVSIDKNEIIDDILYTCADLEIVYPDWNVMKHAIKVWSEEAIYRWNKIEVLATAVYNPLENYDMIENESIQDSRAKTRTDEKTSNAVENGQVKSESAVNNSNANQNTTVNAVTGFNTTTPVTDTQTTVNGTETGNGVSNGVSTNQNVQSGNEKGTGNETETGNIVRSNRRHGNLGVMTPADMIKKELEVYPQLNLYAIIPTEFKMRFCLLVY